MHAFIYRLVERLTQDGPPLSRNRHFHTFETPEGKKALRIARRLRSVSEDLDRAAGRPTVREGTRIRLEIPLRDGNRVAWLSRAEWSLLRKMRPGLAHDLGAGEGVEEEAEAGQRVEGEQVDDGPA